MKEPRFQILRADAGAVKFIGFAKQQCKRLFANGVEMFYRKWDMGGGITVEAKACAGAVKLWFRQIAGGSIVGGYSWGYLTPFSTLYTTTDATYDALTGAVTQVLVPLAAEKNGWVLQDPTGISAATMPNDFKHCYAPLQDINNSFSGRGVLDASTGYYSLVVCFAPVADSSSFIEVTIPQSMVYGDQYISAQVYTFVCGGRAMAIIIPWSSAGSFISNTIPILCDIPSRTLRQSPELNSFITFGQTATYVWIVSSDALTAVRFDTATGVFTLSSTAYSPSAQNSITLVCCKEAAGLRIGTMIAGTTNFSAIQYLHVKDIDLSVTSISVTLAQLTVLFGPALAYINSVNGTSLEISYISTVYGTSTVYKTNQIPFFCTATSVNDILNAGYNASASGIFIFGFSLVTGVADLLNANTLIPLNSYPYTYGLYNFLMSGATQLMVILTAGSIHYQFVFASNWGVVFGPDTTTSPIGFTPLGVYMYDSATGAVSLLNSFGTITAVGIIPNVTQITATPDVDIILSAGPVSNSYNVYGYYPDGTLVTLGVYNYTSSGGRAYYNAQQRMLYIWPLGRIVNVGRRQTSPTSPVMQVIQAAVLKPSNVFFFGLSLYLPLDYYPLNGTDWGAEWLSQTAALQPP